jgi:L-threonylcarbamoyladenylate synthase
VETDAVVEAIRAGLPVLLPTDTVYGLVASSEREDHAKRVYKLKGRDPTQPTALLAATVEALLACVPELDREPLDALLPGPYTLVVENPARRYRWITGPRVDAIGVRVPNLPEAARRVVAQVGCVIATSANDPGGPNPVSLEDVPARIRDGCGAELDIGLLPGTPSTVVDMTGPEPVVLREGAVSAAEAISTIRAWRSRTGASSS